MRFKTFLQENTYRALEDILPVIKKECEPFLKALAGSESVFNVQGEGLVRGFSNPELGYYPHPTDRKPRDSGAAFNLMFNTGFEEAFGIPLVRTKTFFATGDVRNAMVYGPACYVFPKGDFEYYWSDTIGDALDQDFYFYRGIFSNLLKLGFKPDDLPEGNTDSYKIDEGRKIWNNLQSDGVTPSDIVTGRAKKHIEKMGFSNEDLLHACQEYFKDEYVKGDNLQLAIGKKSEVMFTKSDGYYLIPMSLIAGRTNAEKFKSLMQQLNALDT